MFLCNFTQLQSALQQGYCIRFVGRDLGYQLLPSPDAVLLATLKRKAPVVQRHKQPLEREDSNSCRSRRAQLILRHGLIKILQSTDAMFVKWLQQVNQSARSLLKGECADKQSPWNKNWIRNCWLWRWISNRVKDHRVLHFRLRMNNNLRQRQRYRGARTVD